MTTTTPTQIGIAELAERLNRKPATLRAWEREGHLPKKLQSRRNARGWRVWTSEQADQIEQWLKDTDRRPGKGLSNYQPSSEEVDAHISKMRGPRRRRNEDGELVLPTASESSEDEQR